MLLWLLATLLNAAWPAPSCEYELAESGMAIWLYWLTLV
jgi:hypothetical protein